MKDEKNNNEKELVNIGGKMFGRGNSQQEADLEIFTIFDSKSRSYETPTFAKNKDTLLREILNMFKDPSQAQNKFLVNAEDYSIFRVASYDKQTGEVRSQSLEHIANLHDLRALIEPRALSPT